jgi:hypothetical protein
MKSEVLISIAAAGGVDLQQAAKMATNVKPKRDVVVKHGARVLVENTSKGRVHGRETVVMQRPQWTIAEIGQASQDVPETPFRAALYAFAGAREANLWYLHGELMGHARMFRRIYNWPDSVRDFHGLKRGYCEHLCKLVLDEDANPGYFRAAPGLYAMYMTVTETIWDNQLEGRFQELKHVWNDWLGEAARKIQSKLSEHESE